MSAFPRRALLLITGALIPRTARAAGELTVADVESISRQTGVREVAKGSVIGAQGTLNFVGADGKLLLILSLGAAKDYRDARDAFPKRTDIASLGDEAFHPTDFRHALYVRKGDRMAGLGSGLAPATGQSILSQPQLQALAKLAVARL